MFKASKFDPETDPDRPELESIVMVADSDDDDPGSPYIIKRVSYRSLAQVLSEPEPDREGFDMIACRTHVDRPLVWLCYCNKVQADDPFVEVPEA